MIRTAAVVAPVAAKQSAPGKSSGLVLQRKCACGGSAGFAGKCEDCANDQLRVQRRATGPTGGVAPPIVHEVLRSPGRPLDSATRSFMEPRFGHDFSRVRVHADARAAQSAVAVNALAYTVGQDVVFASGRYAPNTSEGRKLLTHELVHTLQQPTSVAAGPLSVDTANSTLERAAHRTAERAMTDRSIALPSLGEGGLVQRQSALSEQTRVPVNEERRPKNWAGEELKDKERNAIKALEAAGLPAATQLAIPGARFVLHDTAGEPATGQTETYLKGVKSRERGPLGEGVNTYVPREGDPQATRPFFTTQRPTAVVSEQALQCFAKLDEKVNAGNWEVWRGRRDGLLRTVWNAASEDAKASALNTVLPVKKNESEGDKLSKTEQSEQISGAKTQLTSAATGSVLTAGLWAVEKICNQGVSAAQYDPDNQIDKREIFKNACDKLKPYFAKRNEGTGSTVHVEMLQQASDKGLPEYDKKDKPKLLYAYTADQYKNVVGLYLRTAYIAGYFPRITTHFYLDAGVYGHHDPRCFNLHYLYREIAKELGHPSGCTYGEEPSYGINYGKDKVWWTKEACHGDPPT
jgi:hypothetical protein